jgi:hypothetical protein
MKSFFIEDMLKALKNMLARHCMANSFASQKGFLFEDFSPTDCCVTLELLIAQPFPRIFSPAERYFNKRFTSVAVLLN